MKRYTLGGEKPTLRESGPALGRSLGREIPADSGMSWGNVQQTVRPTPAWDTRGRVPVCDDVDHGFQFWVDQDPELWRGPALDAWRRLLGYLAQTVSRG